MMAALLRQLASIFLLVLLHPDYAIAAGTLLDTYGPTTAFTTRYWDCCKPSCAWNDHGDFKNSSPVQSCDIDNKPSVNSSLVTGCMAGGSAYSCANNSPWAVNDTFSYGFVGAFMKNNFEKDWCCGCYRLKFTTGPVAGKTMIVQAHNTDYEMQDQNIFTFAIPGGNTSYAGACAAQYNVPNSTFGLSEIGLSKLDECDNLPTLLQPGCRWRFDWFKDAQAPMVEYQRVTCPKELTDITKCIRVDEDTFMTEAAKVGKNGTSGASTIATGNGLPSIVAWVMGTSIVSMMLFL